MLNETQKHKIKGFMADEMMSNAVKYVLREVFLKERGNKDTDVQTLAAERLAIILLEEGFKELKKYSKETKQEPQEGANVGL